MLILKKGGKHRPIGQMTSVNVNWYCQIKKTNRLGIKTKYVGSDK